MGQVRAALRAHLALAVAAGTWRDLARALADAGLIDMAAPSEVRLVRRTVVNMVRAGELAAQGEVRRAWSRRPLKVYGGFAPVVASPLDVMSGVELGAQQLDVVLRNFGR